MGFMDNLKNQIDCTKDKSININIKFGYKEFGLNKIAILRQREDGTVYFNFQNGTLYKLIAYEWNGPIYENLVTSDTNGTTESETTKKGKSGKMTAGALIGSVLMPGVGTVVGAAIGAGGKSKSKNKGFSSSNTVQTSRQVEKDGTAILKFQKTVNGTIDSITIICNSEINSKIKCFNFSPSQTVADTSNDTIAALKGIKALKELLDMGAITQDEFDTKKKKLL